MANPMPSPEQMPPLCKSCGHPEHSTACEQVVPYYNFPESGERNCGCPPTRYKAEGATIVRVPTGFTKESRSPAVAESFAATMNESSRPKRPTSMGIMPDHDGRPDYLVGRGRDVLRKAEASLSVPPEEDVTKALARIDAEFDRHNRSGTNTVPAEDYIHSVAWLRAYICQLVAAYSSSSVPCEMPLLDEAEAADVARFGDEASGHFPADDLAAALRECRRYAPSALHAALNVAAYRLGQSSLGEGTDTDKIAWLIEYVPLKSEDAPAWWWDAQGWTYDHAKAVRFAREVDAAKVIRRVSGEVGGAMLHAKPVEHMWCARSQHSTSETEKR